MKKLYNTDMELLYKAKIKNPEKVFFEGEDEGEKVLLTLRKHPVTNLKWLLVFLLFLVLPIIISLIIREGEEFIFYSLPLNYQILLIIFWYVFAFGYFFTSYLTWFYSVYIVSNMRIVDIDFHDFLHKSFSEAPLRNIEDLTHTYVGAMQPIFDYATLVIQTAGESRELEFELIPQPGSVQDFISDLVKDQRYKGEY